MQSGYSYMIWSRKYIATATLTELYLRDYIETNQNKNCYRVRDWARWVQGLIIKSINFFATLRMLKKEETCDLKNVTVLQI